MAEEREFEIEKQEMETPEGVENTRTGRTYVPRIDIVELNDGIRLFADLPGVDENSLDIMLENDQLTIQGYVDYERPSGYDLAHAEYGIGNFQRVFKLSDQVDQDKITASIKHGVLQLDMPFASGPRTRKITVQAGS
ncbi:MAG: Hsp20/alpha crystallin family protein [Anaerolineales bacterium]|nr:Hsp20/alpha crystallin family protein [Anaerolineales bacterium]MCB8986585.1 Hsp20/alpha crystallin family protein [Ardenticatenaceae bacterium]